MFRYLAFIIVSANAPAAVSAHAGGLEALSQGGPGAAQFQGLWSPDADGQRYPATKNVLTVFRVRYYKQGWKYKRYAAFRTFNEANQYLLKKKMEGYISNLTIHEISAPPQKKDYWLP